MCDKQLVRPVIHTVLAFLFIKIIIYYKGNVMMCHVTSHNVRHIAFSIVLLSNCWLNSSNSLSLQPTSQTSEASTYEARASEFSSSISSTTSLNII